MKTERGVMCEKKRKIIKIRKTENEVNNGREREREKQRRRWTDFDSYFCSNRRQNFQDWSADSSQRWGVYAVLRYAVPVVACSSQGIEDDFREKY